ncbi:MULTISPECIES: site-specific DNA-methyltransferase [unclassified Deinococcus]|uniref:site-specific DNA-methyltransferase n=1 Tax=unclassified Deinococcus TaxID=2623546 RepID=UPI001C301204|nr:MULTISPECIES: site-specific DNA-methyltransferase [unclassified Deinococcus]MDK2012274.1 site-specific DNA-methyltransferase [Deinococcus sp. 43]
MTERRNLKLELTWVGKDNRRPLLEPRILLPDPALSYHAAERRTDHDLFDNRLIFGDNLLALKALATDDAVRGKVKCIFIDPPYNTGSAFEHYDDGLEHSLWLGMMRERLELLRDLLSEDGSIWISIDDNEAHYLKVLCDEIFGRRNFVANIIWRSSDNSNNDAKKFSNDHNHILIYSMNPDWVPYPIDQDGKRDHFRNPDNDPNGPWFDGNPLNSPSPRANLTYEITSPSGHKIKPPKNGWRWSKETLQEKIRTGEIRFTEDGKSIRRRTYLKDMKPLPQSTLFTNLEITGHNRQAKYEVNKLLEDGMTFSTPKPEKLLEVIIRIASKSGDLILDSFAGSGTTGAVAHKMGRRWIMVEVQADTIPLITTRLKKVVDGTDQGGISQAVGWQGGGGFQYFKLAPSLLKKDRWGQYVVNAQYNAEMLAEACCKIEGFTFDPSQNPQFYWMHGRSTERDFIYVTTNYLTYAQLVEISEEVGPERSLLILTTAFDSAGESLENLTLKKIPQSLLRRCDWDHDDYSLNVANLPQATAPDERAPEPKPVAAGGRGRKKAAQAGPGLFGDADGGEG